MPVFTCSGPECPRLISVSSVPGGNPAALADPEGFAVEYLQCRSCKKYFCDRSLVKLGTSMKETRCPACQGALFNPNAAAPATASPATASPATSQMFKKTKVVVTGKSLLFPNICVCCGGPSDATFSISDYNSRTSGNTRTTTTTTWPVSSCKKCAPHIDIATFSSGPARMSDPNALTMPWRDKLSIYTSPLLGLIAWIMIEEGPLKREIDSDIRPTVAIAAAVLMAALGYFVYSGLANRRLRKRQQAMMEENARAKRQFEESEQAKASRTPTCCGNDTGANCVDYSYMPSSTTHTFTFYRKDFADLFARLNQANVTSVENFR